jgi:hypothetical protein
MLRGVKYIIPIIMVHCRGRHVINRVERRLSFKQKKVL